ncbi:hypothetical protein FDC62_10395 [Clostridium botulinum]|uniref:hypothetical protein n=1 Tax=Clostridium botulinum TaxID=1491 RepID=UPI0004DA440E|nr:hypothetical protein [Clostridium botulinum]KEI01611.1 hypothetical protein Z952_12270 [Clostridium botulinum C/D str. BKT75002]KEI07945.1 hypothetical protein Z954_03405 [Clostridium botulinum C/D str. BKT2873]KGM94367.1 hypothetical protein Z956_07560 [Clostridium botulinum D str. CCUG 7971]KOC50660.1 hypothetical protein ADU88_01940 [Clostridium botulinum]MCD3349480.1 hypothetical protein [Clostridium botulinum D/C]
MNQPTIIIVHRLNNRIRVKLSHPLRSVEEVIVAMEKRDGLESFKYNNITKSIVIYFNTNKISMEELIITLSVFYSKQYGMVPIKLTSDTPSRDMPASARYSLGAICISAISKILVSNTTIQKLLNWVAVSTTIGATIEHAYLEINTKGAFDPEVVSVMYLINSIGEGKFLRPSIITWLTTFGRHIIKPYYDNVELKINEICNSNDEAYYTIAVNTCEDTMQKVDFIKGFIFKSIENQNLNYGRNLFLLNEKNIVPCGNRFFLKDRDNCKGFLVH